MKKVQCDKTGCYLRGVAVEPHGATACLGCGGELLTSNPLADLFEDIVGRPAGSLFDRRPT